MDRIYKGAALRENPISIKTNINEFRFSATNFISWKKGGFLLVRHSVLYLKIN